MEFVPMPTESERCSECGGSLEVYSEVEYPGGGFFRCYRCEWCAETGWEAVFLDGTKESGGCVAASR